MILAFPSAYLKGKHFYNKTKSIGLSFRGPEVPVQSKVPIPISYSIFHIPYSSWHHSCLHSPDMVLQPGEQRPWLEKETCLSLNDRKQKVTSSFDNTERKTFLPPLPVGGTLWARSVRFPAVTATVPGFSGNHSSSRWCLQITDKKCSSWVRSLNLLILQSRMAGQERWMSHPHNLWWQM